MQTETSPKHSDSPRNRVKHPWKILQNTKIDFINNDNERENEEVKTDTNRKQFFFSKMVVINVIRYILVSKIM